LYACVIASRSLSASSPEGDGSESSFMQLMKCESSARCDLKYFGVLFRISCMAVMILFGAVWYAEAWAAVPYSSMPSVVFCENQPTFIMAFVPVLNLAMQIAWSSWSRLNL